MCSELVSTGFYRNHISKSDLIAIARQLLLLHTYEGKKPMLEEQVDGKYEEAAAQRFSQGRLWALLKLVALRYPFYCSLHLIMTT